MKKQFRVFIGVIIIVAVFLLFIFLISDPEKRLKTESEEVKKIISLDLSIDYPKTPREVVTLYSRIIKSFYGEEYNEDEFKMLIEHARSLMDEELLDKNPYSQYYSNVQADIASFADQSMVITSYSIASADDVEYIKLEDKKSYAKVEASYIMKSEEAKYKTVQEYVLRKDSEGNWKIVYWTLQENNNESK